MHELLLHASIPSSRHEQVLSILAGVAAMQPVPILERHVIFKATKPPVAAGRGAANQGTQTGQMKALQGQMHGDRFYLKLVENVKEKRDAGASKEVNGTNGATEHGAVVMAENGVNGVRLPASIGTKESVLTSSKSQTEPRENANGDGTQSSTWMLQFRDLPEMNKGRPVTSRAMADIPMTSDDALKLMAAMEYV